MSEDREIPKDISGYEIIGFLGEGGMSVVYLGMQTHPKRKVAIKVLRGGMFSPTAAKRFHQEVEILGKLDHPWIAKIYDAGSHDDGHGLTPFYVMEYLEDALELTDYIKKETPSRTTLLKLFTMITSAVEHGHHRNVVHRDLKPGNILVGQNGEPKIIDFGVARSLERGKVGEEAMTEAGRLVGTIQFMSPEQVDQNILDIDARCDVYSLGAVLYQMLTGRLPRTLEGLPIFEAVRQICQEPPVNPTVYDPTIDRDLEAIIMKSLQSEREERYQSAGAFGRDMLRYLGNKPIKARHVTMLDRSKLFCLRNKNKIAFWSILIVCTLIIAGGVWYFNNTSSLQVDSLKAQVEELEKERLANIVEPVKDALPIEVTPLWSFEQTPSSIAVSSNGTTVFAVIEGEYIARTINGELIALPSISVEPFEASLAISSNGERLGVLGREQCRIVSGTQVQRFQRIPNPITAVEITQTFLAIAGEDFSIQLFDNQMKSSRALSTLGSYTAIDIDQQDGSLLAATEEMIDVWELNVFPKNVLQLKGLKQSGSPMLANISKSHVVVLYERGDLLVSDYETNAKSNTTLSLEHAISKAAFNQDATLLAFISGGTPFGYDLRTNQLAALQWMPEEPVGVQFDEQDRIILWTKDGAFYRSTK